MLGTRKLLAFAALSVLSAAAISGAGYAEGGNTAAKERVYTFNGKEYRETGIDPSTLSIPSAVPDLVDESKVVLEQKRGDGIIELNTIIEQSAPEIDGGSYVDESGNIVIQIASKSDAGLEKKLMKASEQPDKVKIKYVKYSESQLRNSHKIINSKKNLGIVLSMTDIKKNKVTVLVSENNLKKYKAEIAREVPEDMIDWQVGDFRFVDQSATLYPGEQAELMLNASTGTLRPCSVAFSAATASYSKVTFTAGHCGNGTYYDISDQPDTIGSMSNAKAGTGYTYDAGFIVLNASAEASPYLNGSTRTIGTFDYNQARLSGGYSMYLHAASAGGTSMGGVSVVSTSASAEDGTSDLVVVNPVNAQGGDSGGLWYSLITKNNKTYAVIEGIHKGAVIDNKTGKVVFCVFSKVANVYDGYSLKSVYVDSNF